MLFGDRKMPDLLADVKSAGGHMTALKGGAFKGEKELVGEKYLQALCPDSDLTLMGHVMDATQQRGWRTELEGYNEYDLFLAQYAKLKQIASRRLGIGALELFDRYQKVVEAAVLYVTGTGTETGNFYGQRAKVGSVQWFIRPIVPESVDLDDAGGTFDYTTLIFKYDNAGEIGVVQRKNSLPAVGTENDRYVVQSDKQILVLFGYTNSLNPREILEVQEYVNDGVGARIPIDIYNQMTMTDIGLATRPGALIINESKQMVIGGQSMVANVYSDIFPFGVDICTADSNCLTPLYT